MALHVALAHPTAIGGLILIGATAGLDDPDERHRRRRADEAIARRLEMQGLADFMTWWLSKPLFAGLSSEAACFHQRLDNRAAGLAASLRNCGTGTQEPLWDRLSEITVPVLLLAGSDDRKFTTLSRRLAESLTAAPVQQRAIDGTHAVHLEQPLTTAGAVLDFVAWSARAQT
jgi:pimeloyl-ACP methyl ester carboxylesterase